MKDRKVVMWRIIFGLFVAGFITVWLIARIGENQAAKKFATNAKGQTFDVSAIIINQDGTRSNTKDAGQRITFVAKDVNLLLTFAQVSGPMTIDPISPGCQVNSYDTIQQLYSVNYALKVYWKCGSQVTEEDLTGFEIAGYAPGVYAIKPGSVGTP